MDDFERTLAALTVGWSGIREEARNAIQELKHTYIEHWEEAFSHPYPEVRSGAALASDILMTDKPAQVGLLINLLNDSEPGVQYNACEALGNLGMIVEKAVPIVKRLCSSDVRFVRMGAYDAFPKISRKTTENLLFAMQGLDESDTGIRWTAAEALASYGQLLSRVESRLSDHLSDEEASIAFDISKLFKFIDDISDDTRIKLFAFFNAYYHLDFHESYYFEFFEKYADRFSEEYTATIRNYCALPDHRHDLRESMRCAIKACQDQYIPLLISHAQGDNPIQEKCAAIDILGACDSDRFKRDILELLESAINDDNRLIRVYATFAYWKQTATLHSSVFSDTLESGEDDLTQATLLCLYEMGEAGIQFEIQVAQLVGDPGCPFRYEAAEVLKQFGATSSFAIEQLLTMLDDDVNYDAADSLDVLTAMGPAAKQAIPRIIEHMISENKNGYDISTCLETLEAITQS